MIPADRQWRGDGDWKHWLFGELRELLYFLFCFYSLILSFALILIAHDTHLDLKNQIKHQDCRQSSSRTTVKKLSSVSIQLPGSIWAKEQVLNDWYESAIAPICKSADSYSCENHGVIGAVSIAFKLPAGIKLRWYQVPVKRADVRTEPISIKTKVALTRFSLCGTSSNRATHSMLMRCLPYWQSDLRQSRPCEASELHPIQGSEREPRRTNSRSFRKNQKLSR